jgi:hypothetical protein
MALTGAIWHTDHLGEDIRRALTAYDHWTSNRSFGRRHVARASRHERRATKSEQSRQQLEPGRHLLDSCRWSFSRCDLCGLLK